MIYGISGVSVDPTLPYANEANNVGLALNFSPCWLYAHGWIETIGEKGLAAASCIQDGGDPETGLMPDGTNAGHGIMQLTSSWPSQWADPVANFSFAITEFLLPAVRYWHGLFGYSGIVLMKLCGATYNEGLGAAIKYHDAGNVDAGTTNDYAERLITVFQCLLNRLPPPPPV